jgi:hypothetical protein
MTSFDQMPYRLCSKRNSCRIECADLVWSSQDFLILEIAGLKSPARSDIIKVIEASLKERRCRKGRIASESGIF